MPSASAARSRSLPSSPAAKAAKEGKREATKPTGDEKKKSKSSTSSPSKSSPSSPPSSSSKKPTAEELDARVRALYYVMQSVESRLGGGEGVEGLYGSITRTGTARVLRSLTEHASLGPSSHLVDVGAGLGRPLLHALAEPGVALASGVELDAVKCEKAAAFAEQASAALLTRRSKGKKEGEKKEGGESNDGDGNENDEKDETEKPWTLPSLPDIQCCPVEAMPSLEPATHVYSFWEGVPPAARRAFGKLVARSRTVRGVAVVQRAMRSRGSSAGNDDGGDDDNNGNENENDDDDDDVPASPSSIPEAVMADYGFGKLELRDSFPVTMSGSGRSFRAYVFVRDVSSVSLASEQATTAVVAAASAAASSDDSPQSKPHEAANAVAVAAVAHGKLPRACPMLAAAAVRAERERKLGGCGGSWKNITTPTKPSPLSLSRSLSVSSSSSSSSTSFLFRSSASAASASASLPLSSSPLNEREARRARRRAGLPAGSSSAVRQQRSQPSIQSFCRVLRRAGVGSGVDSPLKGGKGGSRPVPPPPSSVSSSSKASSTALVSSPAASAKVLASPKKAGVTKGGSGSGRVAARGLGAAMAKAAAAAAAAAAAVTAGDE